VLFVVEPGEKHHHLAPLVCRDEGRLGGGARCDRLASRVPSVGLEGGRRAKVLGRGSVACAERDAPALLVEAEEYEEPGFAAWPAEALAKIKPTLAPFPGKPVRCRGWCRFNRTGHRRVRVTPEVANRLGDAVESAYGSRPDGLRVLQEVRADADLLHSVVLMDRSTEEYDFAFSALFLTQDNKLHLLRREDGDAVVVRGTFDLGTGSSKPARGLGHGSLRSCARRGFAPSSRGLGHGSLRSCARRGFAPSSRALWLLLTPFPGEGQAHEVLSLSGRQPEVVARRDCRVVEE
jgi:hypothetical protein